jgi:adenylate cyclase class 2
VVVAFVPRKTRMKNRETEVKIRVTDVAAARRQLRKLGFSPLHRRSLEDNVLFDTPGRSLRRIRAILRLRHYGPTWVLTYKGTPDPDQTYKSRVELETEIAEPQALRLIFEVLGLRPVFRYQKYRVQYAKPIVGRRAKPAGEVSLDETPVGNFLELEGSRSWIDRVARQLGFSRRDYITASYGALYLDDCRRRRVPPGDMLFPVRTAASRRLPHDGK